MSIPNHLRFNFLTDEMIEENEQRVAKGAAWLDSVDPDWFWRIDSEQLDLEQPCGCVLGQIVADVAPNSSEFRDNPNFFDVAGHTPDDGVVRSLRKYTMSMQEATDFGFQLDGYGFNREYEYDDNGDRIPMRHLPRDGWGGNAQFITEDFKHLTYLWRDEIAKRQNVAMCIKVGQWLGTENRIASMEWNATNGWTATDTGDHIYYQRNAIWPAVDQPNGLHVSDVRTSGTALAHGHRTPWPPAPKLP